MKTKVNLILKSFAAVSVTLLTACGVQSINSSLDASKQAAASHPQSISFADVKSAALVAAQALSGADECSVTVKSSGNGLVIKITEGRKSASLNLPSNGRFTHQEVNGTDNYNMVGVSNKTLQITNATDAFFNATIIDGPSTVSCEVDF